MISEKEMREALHRLGQISGVETFYPAWDMTYSNEVLKGKLREANELLDVLKVAVASLDKGQDLSILVDEVCRKLNMGVLKLNPLFATTINCLR